MNEQPDGLPTRRTLLSRLKDLNDQESWREFFDTYWRLIYHTALKAGLNDAEAQDVVQETVITVCRHMPRFRYDPAAGSFKTWLLNLTRWRIVDQLRKRLPGAGVRAPAAKADRDSTATIERVADPKALAAFWNDEWEKNLVAAAMERVKQRVDPKHYQAFDLYALQEVPVRQVAETLRLSVAQVYLAKHRITRLIKQETGRLQRRAAQRPA